jgi:magnesium-transporting ATPase (P-type)
MRWHALTPEAVLEQLGSSTNGLTDAEARARLERDGPNALTERRGASWVKKLFEQFLQPLVVVLIGAAVLSVVLGDFVDAAVIGAVVVVNGLLGFFQEYRAEQAIAALRPEYRACIMLRHVEGRSYEEIAATLDLPLGTVKTYIHRARHELRKALEGLRE